MFLSKEQAGFTLIELIMVIVILGILAVAVMGKYQDLQDEAKKAVAQGIAAELSGASKANFAKCAVNASSADCVAVNGSSVNCTSVARKLLVDDGGASFSGGSDTSCGGGPGDTVTCKVTKDSKTANATVICSK